MIILFLNENPLPRVFQQGTISGKELRLRSAIDEVDSVHVIARRGVAVDLPDNKITALERKVRVHLLPYWPYYLATVPLFFWGMWTILRYRPSLIEAESPILSGPAAIILGKVFNIPVVVEVRASYENLLVHKVTWLPLSLKRFVLHVVMSFSLSQADGVIANSRHYQKLMQRKGISSSIINPGLQYLVEDRDQSSDVEQQNLTIGFLGRLSYEKGVDILLEAIALLNKYSEIPPYQVLIAGEGPDKQRLMSLVDGYGLESHVTFVGWQHNYDFLKTVDILVNPNRVAHPLEMVNVEAAALGVPVITFGAEAIPETVIHNETGIVVIKHSAQALASAMEMLLSDSLLRAKMAKQAVAWARSNYSFDSQVKRLRAFYSSLSLI